MSYCLESTISCVLLFVPLNVKAGGFHKWKIAVYSEICISGNCDLSYLLLEVFYTALDT